MKLREGKSIIDETIQLLQLRMEADKTHQFVELADSKQDLILQGYDTNSHRWFLCTDCGVLAYTRWDEEKRLWSKDPTTISRSAMKCKDGIIKDIIE